MADRFCPTCGTEVDADARFCPTCGTTLGGDEEPVLPEAPGWPPPADEEDDRTDVEAVNDERPAAAPAEADAAAEIAAEAPRAQPAPAPPGPPGPTSGTDLPFTWPATIGGWLIGSGAGLGAISLIPRLNDMLSLFLFLALLGVTATVFLADRLPEIANLRLLVLVTVMIGLGVALDRAAFTVRGLETLLLIAMLAAAGGVILVELDRDRPVPPPSVPRT